MPTLFQLIVTAAASAGFDVELREDIVQRRDVVDPGHQVVELVRILPPREEPWTMAVHVPDGWLDKPRSAGLSTAQAASSSEAQLSTLVAAVRRDIPWAGGLVPVDAAALWTGLLRNSAYANPHPVSHYDGVLTPWEVLYDDQAGDTLSAAFTALQALERQGIQASLCRYPTPSTTSGVAFGLILEGSAPADADWAWAVSGITPGWVLLPLHLKAKPAGNLDAVDLEVWSAAEVAASGWSPGAAPAREGLADGDPAPTPVTPAEPDGAGEQEDAREPDPGPAPDPTPPPPPQRTPRPDICDQAEAMGLECVQVDHSDDGLYLFLALISLGGLLAAGIGAWVARNRRQARAKARARRRKAEEF